MSEHETIELRTTRYDANRIMLAARAAQDAEIDDACVEALTPGFYFEPPTAPVFIRLTVEQMQRTIGIILNF